MEYHKIHSLFKRNEQTNELILGDWSIPEFEYLQNTQWSFTEKVDGTNIRVMWGDGKITFGGKTEKAKIQPHLLARLEEIFEGKEQLFKGKFEDHDVVLYGEGFGMKINLGEKYLGKKVDFILFDVKVGYWWLERNSIEDIAKYFGIPVVPVIGQGTLHDAMEKTKQGFHSNWGDFAAEGIVARPTIELKTRMGHRIIAKIKHEDFVKSSE